MAIIPMPTRPPRLAAVRSADRVEAIRPADHQSPTPLLMGIAIVASCVLGLLAYDRTRPVASGFVPTPLPLIIAVEPMPSGAAQPR